MGWIIYNADGTVASSGGSGGITQLTGNVTAGPGSGSQVATIPAGTVTEAMQILANNTTNNVSISKHGYAPILPNDNTKFLDGTGAYSTPPGSSPLTTKGDLFGFSTVNARLPVGSDTQVLTADSSQTLGIKWAAAGASGGLVLLEEHTASASATLDFTTAITSTYDDYRVEIIGLVPATNNTDLQMLVSTNGGSTWANSGYAWMREADFIGGSGMAPGSSSSDTQFVLFPGLDNSIADASTDATISIKHPGNATLSTVYFGQMTTWYQPSSPRFYSIVLIGGKWRTQTAVNAIQFKMSSGNITSGTIRVYGLAK